MAISPSLTLYRIFGNRVVAGSSGRKLPPPEPRPQGRLIWLHSPRSDDHAVAQELLALVADDFPDVWFLLTTEGEKFDTNLDQTIFHTIKSDRPSDAREFLDCWQPDLAIWLSDHLLPTLIHEAAARQIPLFLLDSGAAFKNTKSTWFLPGLTRRTLRKFDVVLSSDEATSLALISSGAMQNNVKTTGALELTVSPPPCNDAEWSTLSSLLATRPVWLAANITFGGLESILTAHTQATRRTHRLLLIIVPTDPLETKKFQSVLNKRGFVFATRSQGEEPDSGVQVYLADTEDEMGLWYRLAPVCFIGNPNGGTAQNEPNPLAAAALGSVVLHGLEPGPHEVSYQRLVRAGASRPVTHPGELAHVLEAVLAPDRAAVMAHAAWQITSSGAEAMGAARQAMSDAIDALDRPKE